jgi:hypothetical protein
MTHTIGIVGALAAAALQIALTSPVYAKDHSAEYQVGVFSSTGTLSDGSYAQCGGGGCRAYSAGHNVHYVRVASGLYAIESPVSIGGTLLLAMIEGANAPDVHKQWFMDQLHAGDKILFWAQCNKHNNCTMALPNPDKPGKEFITQGYFTPDVARTNTQGLCGRGKLSAAVEADVCK